VEDLRPGGNVIVLVPQGPSLYGTVDRSMGHLRRYTRAQISRLMTDAGFRIERVRSFNKAGAPSWWLYSRVLDRSHLNKLTLKLFDKTVWLWRRIDGILPWKGLSLIVVARKEAA
jgi:hypothetical protein